MDMNDSNAKSSEDKVSKQDSVIGNLHDSKKGTGLKLADKSISTAETLCTGCTKTLNNHTGLSDSDSETEEVTPPTLPSLSDLAKNPYYKQLSEIELSEEEAEMELEIIQQEPEQVYKAEVQEVKEEIGKKTKYKSIFDSDTSDDD